MRTLERMQSVRRTIIFASLLAFPVTMNWMSPYVIMDGAIAGFLSGSALLFTAFFLTAPVFGRLWCSWLCPAGCLGDVLARARKAPYGGGFRNAIKYVLWGLWLAAIVAFFIVAGGIHGIDPLRLTESGISIDEPGRYVVYYGVISLFFFLDLGLGRRAACHSICWMAPFMVSGRKLGVALRVPRFRLQARKESCVSCGTCARECPMSLEVPRMIAEERMENSECILCGNCASVCPHGAVEFVFGADPRGSKWAGGSLPYSLKRSQPHLALSIDPSLHCAYDDLTK